MSSLGHPRQVSKERVRFLQRPIARVSAALGVAAIVLLACSNPQVADSAAPAQTVAAATPAKAAVPVPTYAEFQKTVQPFLASHCYACHGPNDEEGDVRLDSFHDDASLAKGIPTLEKALKMLNSRKMPPKDEPRPSEAEYTPVVAWVDTYTHNYYMNGPVDPGRVTLHRLNRVEYNNTVRDLLGLTDFHPADAFPVDDAGYGFDNNGDVLSIAPMLMEKYLTAASLSLQKVLFADPAIPPHLERWDALTSNNDLPKTDQTPAQAAAVAPVTRGRGTATGRIFPRYGNLYADYVFPKDGDYVFSFRGYNAGAGRSEVQFYVDTTQIGRQPLAVNEANADAKLFSTDATHVTAGKHRIYLSFRNGATLEEYAAAEAAFKATPPPAPVPAADAAAADQAAADQAAADAAAADADPAIAAAAAAPAGRRGGAGARGAGARGAGARGRGPAGPVGPSVDGRPQLAVVFFEVEGPMEITPDRMPESYRKLMIAQPSATVSKPQAADKIIRNFATRAYRRPVTDEEVKPLLALWSKADGDGRPFEQSLYVALQAVLASPKFLFRVEQDPQPGEANNIHTLNEYELASRLSYFLWSSMPDDELFALAAKGQLHANLDQQVDRMLKDPKAQALVDNFAGQWLQLRQMDNVNPDAAHFPDFDPALREAMLKETQMFFTSIMQENRSILDFINANYTFVNGRLAKFYGLPGITGDAFQRYTFPPNSPRGGLLTQASILTITSYSTRTSPVLRGKWVLENLLDSAPPPPPPNVPALAEGEKADLNSTLKQRMEEHRANPNCAVCHERMDAIGFSLENFDATGAWRTTDTNKQAIDASGTLPDGKTINGAADLKKILLDQQDQFCRCVADRMLTYALGRGTEPSDQRTVANIVTAMQKNGDKFSVLINSIVHSDAFQKQRGKQTGDNS